MTLSVALASIELQNPILLAAGTAAYGAELDQVMSLDLLGGLVTKAVSVAPREGAPAPRVAEFAGGMINAVGLANPGMDEVARVHLPWLAANVRKAKVLVNVVGFATEEFGQVVATLDPVGGMHGYELNLSCPNVKAGGLEFGADPAALSAAVKAARSATARPIFVKLSPTLASIETAALAALDAGADGITVINTIPGLVIDVDRRTPALGYGTGGVSGPGLLPVGVLATYKVWKATGGSAPIIGLGGVRGATDVLQYVMAGATAVGIGTAALRDPRVPEAVVAELEAWCARHSVRALADVRGSLRWPS